MQLEAENAELRASHTEQEEMVAELRKCAQENRAKVVELKAELDRRTAILEEQDKELLRYRQVGIAKTAPERDEMLIRKRDEAWAKLKANAAQVLADAIRDLRSGAGVLSDGQIDRALDMFPEVPHE